MCTCSFNMNTNRNYHNPRLSNFYVQRLQIYRHSHDIFYTFFFACLFTLLSLPLFQCLCVRVWFAIESPNKRYDCVQDLVQSASAFYANSFCFRLFSSIFFLHQQKLVNVSQHFYLLIPCSHAMPFFSQQFFFFACTFLHYHEILK